MQPGLFFQFQNSYRPVSTYGGQTQGSTCGICGRFEITARFDNLVFDVKSKMKEWPLVFGGSYHTAVHRDVVDAFELEGITGATFHPLKKLEGKALAHLSEPPDYYIFEPTGSVNIHVPWDEFVKCDECGSISSSQFGEFKKPFLFDWDSWDGSDVVCLRNVYQFWICCNRRVVDLFRKRGWHHQIAYGRNNRRFESLSFGDNPVPGVGVRNIDSDTWYDDTVFALREKYPQDAEILLAGIAHARESSAKREPKPLVVIHTTPPFAFDPENPPSPQAADGHVFLPDLQQNLFYANIEHRHSFFGKKDYWIFIYGVNEFTAEHRALIELVRTNLESSLNQIVEPYNEFHASEKIAQKSFLEPTIVIGSNDGEPFDGTSWRLLVDFDKHFFTHLSFRFNGARLIGHGAITLNPVISE